MGMPFACRFAVTVGIAKRRPARRGRGCAKSGVHHGFVFANITAEAGGSTTRCRRFNLYADRENWPRHPPKCRALEERTQIGRRAIARVRHRWEPDERAT